MKKLIIAVCICSLAISSNAQGQSKKTEKVLDERFGMDFGFGVNSFATEHDSHTKISLDLGLIYELKEKILFGIDFTVSPKKEYEETGKDGSRSTHVGWDGQAVCVEAHIGHKLFDELSLFAGLGTCFTTEYEVKKGYSNLSSYKRGNKTYFSPVIGLIYDFPVSYRNDWYLKYDMAIGGYDRFSLSVGIKF